ANGVYGPCSIRPKSADSCVMGNDGNCNGVPNDNSACTCLQGATRLCAAGGSLGNCPRGHQTCGRDGQFGPCGVQSKSADACDVTGDDSNCDGTPNGGCPCVDGATQSCGPEPARGACKKGTSTCANSTWGACQGAVYPSGRDCTSSADNDCDGTP